MDREYSRIEVASVVEPTASESEVVARWGGIAAGLFIVLSLLVLLGEIGMAIGLSSFEPGDRAASYAIGAGIWGILSAIIAFAAGGYIASRISRHVRPRAGTTQGLMVWAMAIPVIGILAAILAIGTTTAAGVATVAAIQADPAAAAEARETARASLPARADGTVPTEARPAVLRSDVREAAKKTGATAWAAVGGMLLSLGAAMLGGSLGTRGTALVVTRPVVSPPLRTGNIPV